MATSKSQTPQIVQLAQRLEDDIQSRGLRPGDPYLGTEAASRMLGVSNASANRALQLLVKRAVLRRRQRIGTFIAEPNSDPSGAEIGLVHILVHQSYLRSEGLLTDGVILGLQEKLPQAEIQVNFMPANDDGGYVNRLVAKTLGSKQVEGYVLVRAPLAVHRVVAASGLPVVIHGGPIPSVTGIPWINRDNYQGARLAAAHLIREGVQNLTVITRDHALPADNQTFQGVRDEMIEAGLPLGALDWRSLPSDTEVVRHDVSEILGDGPRSSRKQRHGFICRSCPAADGAAEAIVSTGRKLGRDAGVVLLDAYPSGGWRPPPYPYLLMSMNPETVGQRIGQFLLDQANGVRLQPDYEMISMTLVEGATRGAPM